jgi:hypothetical protein
VKYEPGDMVWYNWAMAEAAGFAHYELVRIVRDEPGRGGYIVSGVLNGVTGGVAYDGVIRMATPEELAATQLVRQGGL